MHDPETNPPQPSDADEALQQLPVTLVAGLRHLNASASPTTDARMGKLDAAIISAAAEHFATMAASPVLATLHPRRRIGHRLAAGIIALAAAIALAVILPGVFNSGTENENGQPSRTHVDPRTHPSPIFAEADINRDGQVNLLDAYVLQRRIEMQAKLESAWDLTHDGTVDQRDVQAIATESVKLPAATSSPAGGASSLPTGGASSLAPAERGRL